MFSLTYLPATICELATNAHTYEFSIHRLVLVPLVLAQLVLVPLALR